MLSSPLLLLPFVKFIITSVAYNATSSIILPMTLEEIKKNLTATAKAFASAKNVDTNSIMLLSIAHALVLLLENVLEKDKKDGYKNELYESKSEEE